jgi:uncharacterized protein (DUF1800 family)
MRLGSHQENRKIIASLLGEEDLTIFPNEVNPDQGTPAPDSALYSSQEATVFTVSAPEASALLTPPLGVIAWNRIAFGPRPGDIDAFGLLGEDPLSRLAAFVDQQLDPNSIDDSALEARLADPAYTTLGKTLEQLWLEHYRADVAWAERIRPAMETQYAAFVRATYSKRQLVEVLADFWHNHFNVYSWDMPMAAVWVHYDRDVIRPHLLGNFRDMLEANAKSTAMLYYLDNVDSSDDGPNENYARELCELHTMGAENYLGTIQNWEVPHDGEGRPVGYVEGDVLEIARCFTGWSVANAHWTDPEDPDTGVFRYRNYWHDRFQKYVLGDFLPADQSDLKDGRDVLDKLAEHPGTATFVCRKLCRRLISDNPREEIVSSAAQVFHDNWQASDQLKLVVRHILLSEDFRNTWGEKIKRPFETVVSAMRACEADVTLEIGDFFSDVFRWLFDKTGHYPYSWGPPNGYPDFRAIWQGTTALVMTWRTLSWLLHEEDGGFYYLDVLGATLADFPDPGTRTPRNLADFWFQRILGYQPDVQQVTKVATLLDHSDYYTGSWGLDTPVDLSQDAWPHYWQSGLRSMVGLILMSPEFLQR